jgi:hypothetical protein
MLCTGRLFLTRCGCCLLAAMMFATAGVASAQEPSVSAGPQFAPGVLTTIEPNIDPVDTVGVHDVVELRSDATLSREPLLNAKSRTLYEMSQQVPFRREVWCLELSFKPLRMMVVDIPQASGKMQRKLVWYLVYRVRNTGVAIAPVEQDDGNFTTINAAAQPHRFIPQFVLASQDTDSQGNRVRKEYLDRIVPAAMPAIQRREMPRGELLNSAEMAEQVLEPENGRMLGGLWGVAIWEDVDPEIDFFSVFVGGLTNAYRWQDAPEGFRAGDPSGKGRTFLRKTLQLNFWRPGDELAENEREIRFGAAPRRAAAYGTTEGVAYRWVYR